MSILSFLYVLSLIPDGGSPLAPGDSSILPPPIFASLRD